MRTRLWDPFAEMMSMRQMMDRLLAESYAIPQRTPTDRGGSLVLPVDVYDTGDTFTVKAPLPGVEPEDVRISVTGSTISIHAEARQEEVIVPERYLYQERVYGAFHRDVALPSPVLTDKAEARFDKGVLIVVVPKADEGRRRQIEVHAT